ncbi:APC family permease [Mycoplasma sp. P36-A1]|uniref:APC family permease n=1 Tax=Mycoplasma sp. P36-A1 TaxID=3252900 RepID=UPI003C2F2095
MNKKITFTEALLTAVGMVIGSGIYFRADNILAMTHANVGVAILAWLVLGFTLIFAGIGMSVLAARSTKEGGIVGYMEECYGNKAAFITGWFTTFVYIPTLMGILSIVASGFLLDLVSVVNPSAILVQGVALCLLLLCYAWNYFSTKFSALFSSAATIIKLFPIVIVGVMGMAKFDMGVVSSGIGNFEMALFTAPLLSMAFAFDGWTSVATLSRDMENPQKDIAKVLAINAIIVTAAYVLYFTGMTMLFKDNPQRIVDLGDGHVAEAATMLLGNMGGKLIIFCVVISVMGTLNGNLMAAFRYPHALAVNNDLPNSKFFAQETKYGTTGNASYLTLAAALVWFVLYSIQAIAAEGAADGASYMFSTIAFDDIPIMAMAILIIILLLASIKYGTREGAGILKSVIAPVIGIIGQGYIVYSFISTNEAWALYSGIVILILVVGYFINNSVKKSNGEGPIAE